MTEEEERIARAWTQWSGWEWRPGMRVHTYEDDDPTRLVSCVEGEHWAYDPADREGWPCTPMRPDTDDPATMGAILGLVREAWGDPLLHVACSIVNSEWSWYAAHSSHPGPCLPCNGNTEIEVLLAAALAAPVEP